MDVQTIIDKVLEKSDINLVDNRAEAFALLGFQAMGINAAYIDPDTNPHVRVKETIVMMLSKNDSYRTSCFFHELVHSTGRKGRLYRGKIDQNSPQDVLAEEELVAEKGAMIILDKLGLSTAEVKARNEDYILHYSRLIADEGARKKATLRAFRKAEEAAAWIFANWLNDLKLQETA